MYLVVAGVWLLYMDVWLILVEKYFEQTPTIANITYMWTDDCDDSVSCIPDLSWSIFLTKDTHSSPVRWRCGCLSWAPILTKILPSNLLCRVQWRVILYREISRVYSICILQLWGGHWNVSLKSTPPCRVYNMTKLRPGRLYDTFSSNGRYNAKFISVSTSDIKTNFNDI